MKLADRREAGRFLAAELQRLAPERPVVVALPRGGVPVAYEVARVLEAPLEILAVRKLGAPGHPEFGVGAITEDGNSVLDTDAARRVGMTQELLDDTVAREAGELRRRVERYRHGLVPVELRGRTVIIVDDGLATGLTDLAAVRAIRARGAARIVVGVPVGSREAVALLAEEADEVVCLTIPRDLEGVGLWYRDFSPVSDEEVVDLLASAADPTAPPTPTPSPGPASGRASHRSLRLELGGSVLSADLDRPRHTRGLVIFAHGSGSSRLSPRNRTVAAALVDLGFATLLLDLLTEQEASHREFVFDIPLLARRLELATDWTRADPATRGLPVGYFGASTGAAAALRAAAAVGDRVHAVVSRGGRPDLADDRLPHVTAPTLLIVGSDDREVLDLNRRAAAELRCPHRLTVVEGAGHLFEEPGTLEAVVRLAGEWFAEHLPAPTTGRLASAGA